MPTDRDLLHIARIGLTVADLASASDFYERALGFRVIAREHRGGPAFAAVMGMDHAEAEVAVLGLGGQTLELVAFSPAGEPYPQARNANDPWFQHFAIVTADMAAAYASLDANGRSEPISSGGPVLLPPSTGSIMAYKFRDPEGHPLELSYFPPGVAGAAWRDPPAGAIFLGVDHSAISVTDVERSIGFYVDQLGMRVGARQVNSGPTQDRLDGLDEVQVDIVTLTPPGDGPHLELLAYRQPTAARGATRPSPNDVAATRLVLQVEELRALAARLQASGAPFVSKGVVVMDDGSSAVLVRDPDGHLIELRDPA